MKITTSVAAIATFTLAIALAGCASTPADSEESGAAELTTVTVGVTPNLDIAPLFLGMEKGFFAEEGLEIDAQPSQGGAAMLPAVMSGSYDVGFSATASIIAAKVQGLDVKLIAPGAYSSGQVPDTAAVVARPDSGIEGPLDLQGKTVATNGLNNIFATTVSAVIDDLGGDGSLVNWIELPWPDQPAALLSGQIDAATVSEPFLTATISDGAVPIVWNWYDVDPDLLVAGYFASGSWVTEDSETADAFVRAITKSLEYAAEHDDEVRDAVGTYTELTDEVRDAVTLAKFRTDIDVRTLQLIADLSFKYRIISGELDVNEILVK